MRRLRGPTPSELRSLRRALLLAALVLFTAMLALAYARARYSWRDVFAVLGATASNLSRKRLALAVVVQVGTIWLLARRLAAPPVATPALMAYAAGMAGDMAILLLLEPLGISYGPVLLPLAFLAGARTALAAGLAIAQALLRRHVPRPAAWLALHVAGQAIFLAAVLDGFALEPARLTVSHISVPNPHSVPGQRPVRIVQISDLHLERAGRLAGRIAEETNRLQPDVVLLTGDYISSSYTNDPQAHAGVRRLLSALHPTHGTYAILGNVDPPAFVEILFSGLPVRLLEDEWIRLEVRGQELAIAAVSEYHSPAHGPGLHGDRSALHALARAMPEGSFSILMVHAPNLVPEAAQAGFDQYITGHTHGGQFRLPLYGALTTFSIYGKRYEMGAYQEQETLVYVSRGVGMQGWLVPRVRFLCPPEIVCFDIGG